MIYSLQLFRYIAALLVVVTHSMGEFEGMVAFGAFGVDIFFVISGFVISMASDVSKNNFLIKRVIRIVPLYWIFTIFIACIAIASPSLLNTAVFDFPHFLSSLFFIPLWNESSRFNPILLLGWTLNFEMFFYLLFGIAMRLNYTYRELMTTSALIFFMIIPLLWPSINGKNPLVFYGDSILLEFCFGMGLAVVFRKNPSFFHLRLSFIFSVLLISTLLFFATSNSEHILQNFPRLFHWGIPSLLVVYSVVALKRYEGLFSARMKRTFNVLGEISYPLYLCHMFWIGLLSRILNFDSFFSLFFSTALCASLSSYLLNSLYDIPVRAFLKNRLLNKH